MQADKISKDLDAQLFAESIASPSTSVISGRLHHFFARQGLPRHKHASQLAAILGLSRSGAFRKFQDGSFSAGDLQALAQHFQVDVSLLLSAPSFTPTSIQGQAARIFIGSRPIECQAAIGTPLGPDEHCELVATQQGSDWLVQPYAMASVSVARHRVINLSITPIQRQQPRLAVLEDSVDLAANLKEAFESAGFRVEVFTSAAELSHCAENLPFDAYIVDWWLSGQTAASVLQSIRKNQPTVPLVLITGAIANGNAKEDDIVRISAAQRIHVVEKPFRLALLIAQINQLLGETA